MIVATCFFVCVQLLTAVLGFLNEGDLCLEDGIYGACTMIHNCPEAKEMLLENKYPTLCGFEGNLPMVCCKSHPELYSRNRSLAEKMCESYSKIGIKETIPLTTGGETTFIKKFPYMAALGYGDNENDIKFLCSGSLISERFVLTVAQCLTSRDDGRVRWVRLGDRDLSSGEDDAATQTVPVAATHTHPDYSPPVCYHDVALVRLESAAVFTERVRPACLHTAHYEVFPGYGGAPLTVASYGGDGGVRLLREVRVMAVQRQDCELVYGPGVRLPEGIRDEYVVCAAPLDRTDLCREDSGSPLLLNGPINQGEIRIVAIASFGKPCPAVDTPVGCTRVYTYLNWIESVVWQDTA